MIHIITFVLLSQIHHFDFAAINSPQTAGTPFSISVYARDSLGNLVTNYNDPARVFATPGIQYGFRDVVFNSGVWQGDFTATLAGSYTLSCQDYSSHTGESNTVDFNAGSPDKLLAIMPGQTYYPGVDTGKIGVPNDQNAGTPYNVSIYLTDSWSNLITSMNDSCQITSSDSFARSVGFSLTNGQATVPFANRTAGYQFVYAHDITTPAINSGTSSRINVDPGYYAALLVLLPGETAVPGDTSHSSPGKTGEASSHYVSEDFDVIVYATDTMWNRTTDSGNQVRLFSDFSFSNPSPVSLNNGIANFTIYFNDTGRVILWAEDLDTNYDSYNNYLTILSQIDTTIVTDSLVVYPNPLGINNQNTMTFAYYLPYNCEVIFAIYDPFGNLVFRQDMASGTSGARGAGMNYLTWHGQNEKNQRVASGVYYAIIKAWTHTATVFHRKLKVGVVW